MSMLVASCEGQFVKTLPRFSGARIYGWHESYGLVSEQGREDRARAQRRKGAIVRAKHWEARFKLEWQGNLPLITPLDGLKMEKTAEGWHLVHQGRAWGLQTAVGDLAPMPGDVRRDDEKFERALMWAALILMVLLLGGGRPRTR